MLEAKAQLAESQSIDIAVQSDVHLGSPSPL
jgi:hypothetical protein